jgi:uncharacterized protein (DUF1330 family)
MKYYSVAEIEMTDQGWVRTYIKDVTRMVEQRCGRYLARTSEIEKLKGEWKVPQIFLIIEWPSKDVARGFYECDEYRPYCQSRMEGAKSEFLLVAGEDLTKTAQIAD